MRKFIIMVLAVPLALVALAGPVSAAKGGSEHLTITFDPQDPDAPGVVVATGPISGTGTNVQTSFREAGRTVHAVDVLTFAEGSITVKDVSVTREAGFDPATCAFHELDKGVFTITSGTGAYASAKGHGHFTVTVDVQSPVDPSSPDGCDFSITTGSIVVEVDGTVKL